MVSVALCGSRKFKQQNRSLGAFLESVGIDVKHPHLLEGGDYWKQLPVEYQRLVMLGLTHDHIQKIREADAVHIVNPGGYIGVNTTIELGAALALGKPITAEADDPVEMGRSVLIRRVIPDREQLAEFLRRL